MSRTYAPRRASARWLDGACPADVLCILDNGGKTFDRYTVFYRHVYPVAGYPGWTASIFGRGMSDHPSHPQGFGCSLEMRPHEVAAYRYRSRNVPFSTLPPDVQACIIHDCQPGGLGSNAEAA